MPSTNYSKTKPKEENNDEIRFENHGEPPANHARLRGAEASGILLVDASREITAVVWLQGSNRLPDQDGFSSGGSFTQKMHITGAGDFSLTGKYDEVVEPEKIAYHAEIGGAMTRVTIEFVEQGNRTKVILTHEGFPDESFCKNVSQGTGESLDKLDLLLAGRVSAGHV
jgi:Activator of Hsp90 ATPase homolog 1-like protein